MSSGQHAKDLETSSLNDELPLLRFVHRQPCMELCGLMMMYLEMTAPAQYNQISSVEP
jgi:hypothetical protein